MCIQTVCRSNSTSDSWPSSLMVPVLKFTRRWNLSRGILGCDAVSWCGWIATFRRTLLTPSTGWSVLKMVGAWSSGTLVSRHDPEDIDWFLYPSLEILHNMTTELLLSVCSTDRVCTMTVLLTCIREASVRIPVREPAILPEFSMLCRSNFKYTIS
jgi:hypothetical protein